MWPGSELVVLIAHLSMEMSSAHAGRRTLAWKSSRVCRRWQRGCGWGQQVKQQADVQLGTWS